MRALNFMKIYVLLFFIFLSGKANSQWSDSRINVRLSLPQIALVDIEPGFNNSIHFTILPSAESGNSAIIQQTSGERLWINYSSALPGHQYSRSIIAEISQGIFPEGINFFIEASAYSGTGRGQLGQSAGKINITNQPKPIITNLGNCFTGDGENRGHLLNFSMEIDDYSKVYSIEETAFTLLYTITDN